MPTWEIVLLIVIGVPIFIAAIRFGFIGLFLDILFAILSGGKSGGGGSFGGGSFGGGGSSSDDD